MEEFVFRLLDRYGVSIVIVVMLVLVVWKVAPEIVKVWIDKIRAETDLIRATQTAVTTTLPTAISDLKTTFVSEHKTTVTEIKGAINADTDRRIEEKLAEIAKEQARIVSKTRGAALDTDNPPPPSRAPLPSQPV